MASSALDDKLTNEIFSILENKFLFGQYQFQTNNNVYSPGKVRILSIDAGGDAILAANTLIHFQSILRRKSGIPSAHISDFFDVVTGAGAGGILAGLLFTPKDGVFFTPEESLKFMVDNRRRKLGRHSLFGQRSKGEKVLKKVFGEMTLKDTVKSVLIPCYDLRTGAPFVFSRADAMEMEGCDFTMAGVCGATVADRAVEVKSTDGRRKIVAVGGGVGMSNPTAAAITHVLNNKQEFPLCRGVQDLLVVSLGNPSSSSGMSSKIINSSLFVKIAGDGAADMVDEAVSMAFGDEWRASNYLRINSVNNSKKVEEMLGAKNMESVLFKGKRLVEMTNMEKLEIFAGELIKEKERRNQYCISHQHQNMSNYSPRSSSSDTTTLSSTTSS
ncbi:hypothetical protein ABFS82_10G177000 [Erythranthe guttata]|uniref:PNPLA domain-containing protein n=1 Tax=Erythranthe guttata TaxID=4155 RepID=A0A022RIK3_ERYGU|nr:PREDICTED: patatin-like protein 7 [Erythranthe guttata]EYU39996.1 hypothetical protein MIMGU_mgv1a008077mg [Erythranthe guttata]|eukprot:XP_012834450.1 PREDICTED: patatin-like protein 7 [Erythranthe guttata]